MTNLQAALGLAQLERLDKNLEIKQNIGRKYLGAFTDIGDIRLPLVRVGYACNIFWVFGFVLASSSSFSAAALAKALAAAGVGTRPFFFPLHKQPVFLEQGIFSSRSCFPVAESLGLNGLYIPSGLAITNDQLRTVVREVRSLLVR